MIGTERRAGAQAAISCFSASSISDISPGSNRNSAAPMTPETCFTLRKPTIAPVTDGLFSVRAMATFPGVGLWRFPISRRRSTNLRFRDSSGSWKLGRFLRQSSAAKFATRWCVMAPVSSPADIGEYTMTPMLFRSAKGRISFSIARHVFRPRARSDIMGFPISVSQNAAGAGHCSDYVFAASLFNCHSAPSTLPRCLRPVRANESGRDRSHRFAVGAGCLRIRAESTEP